MADIDCINPEEHCALHACQMKPTQRSPEVDKMYQNPRFICENCGAKVHNRENLCRPREL